MTSIGFMSFEDSTVLRIGPENDFSRPENCCPVKLPSLNSFSYVLAVITWERRKNFRILSSQIFGLSL